MAVLKLNEENIEGKVSTIRYDSEGHQISTNHTGWNVEKFSTANGWKPITETPFEVRSDAQCFMELAVLTNPKNEYRVYEALEFPPKNK